MNFVRGFLTKNLSSNSECREGRLGDSPTSLRRVNDSVPAFSTY
jgi:hypothetical protein